MSDQDMAMRVPGWLVDQLHKLSGLPPSERLLAVIGRGLADAYDSGRHDGHTDGYLARAREDTHFREFAHFALEVLAIGGNGEGWTLGDAVAALRVALGEDGTSARWRAPVSDEDWERLRQFVGDEAVRTRRGPHL